MSVVLHRRVPLETITEWDRIRNGLSNPLNLTEETVEKSLKLAPPKDFSGGTWLGRYLIPMSCISRG